MFKQERINIATYSLYLFVDIIFLVLSFGLPYIIRWNVSLAEWHKVFIVFLNWRQIEFPTFENYCMNNYGKK